MNKFSTFLHSSKPYVAAILSTALLLQTQLVSGAALDRIVAIAGEEVILQSELDNAIQEVSRQIQSRGTALPPERALQEQVLDQSCHACKARKPNVSASPLAMPI